MEWHCRKANWAWWHTSISTSGLETEIGRSNFKAFLSDQVRLALQMKLKNKTDLSKLSKAISQYGGGRGSVPSTARAWVCGCMSVCV